jgi:hypothetical protein
MFFKKTCISGGSTNDLNTDKGEVGGSSPPRPTINPSIYAVILSFAGCGTAAQKAICQLFANFPGEPI